LPNKFVIFDGGVMLNAIYTTCQSILAKGHQMKRWSIVSFWSQKQYLAHPCHFLLTKLSFVGITFLCRNHMKILIFKGTFIFQMYFLRYTVCPFNKSKYIDLTVNTPDKVKFHLKISSLSLSL
jgi:hypothetical protein